MESEHSLQEAYAIHARATNSQGHTPPTLQIWTSRGDDSQGHIFGSCMHPDMSKQHIARHDKAMRTVIQAFTKGQVVTI